MNQLVDFVYSGKPGIMKKINKGKGACLAYCNNEIKTK
jgi:hypothetical protein